jgi:uncharacterized membrane protein
VLTRSLKQTIEWLRSTLGPDQTQWQWGKLHRAAFPHAMALQKPLDRVFNRGPYPIGGDTDTVCQVAMLPDDPYDGKAWAPTYRQIVDLGDLSRSQWIYAPGQSGQLGNKHYDDLIDPWRKGETIPMLWTREQIESAAEGKLVLKSQPSTINLQRSRSAMTAQQPVVVAAFEDEAAAQDALRVVKEAHHENQLKFIAYAIVRRDEEGKLHVKETGDPGGVAGAVSGGALGLAVGLLAGPVGLAAVAGAVMGGLAMKWFDSGVKNAEIRAAGESLKSGMAALVVLAEEGSEDLIAEKLRLSGGNVTGAALAEEDEAMSEENTTDTTASPAEGAAT